MLYIYIYININIYKYIYIYIYIYMTSRVCISLVTHTDINNIIKQKTIHIIFFYKIKKQIISNGVVHEYLSSHRTLLHVMQV